MKSLSTGLIIGISAGVVIGLLLAIGAMCFFRFRKKRSLMWNRNARTTSTIPIRSNGIDSSNILSDSTTGQESPKQSEAHGRKRKNMVSKSGVPKYSYKDLKKATSKFTTVIGEGAFGKVYVAEMSTGQKVAVKELAANSKQGEEEFQTEVLLLGRLHHRNLVNLVGYCTEKGKNMLIYVFMPNGSLASHLYDEKQEPLNWDTRIDIALDVARGLEYLHDGANPPVLHRDIKSSNILLDQSMRARVADFGLSKEDTGHTHATSVRGTFGYLDPEYVSTRKFTKKSDVYSFGVLLFELITGKNPEHGLMEHVELAAMDAEDSVGWEEIVDPRMDSRYDVQELNELAALAFKCISPNSKKRPSMRDIVQALSPLVATHNKKHHRRDSSLATLDEENIEFERVDVQISISDSQIENEGCLHE